MKKVKYIGKNETKRKKAIKRGNDGSNVRKGVNGRKEEE
jgi:hypothetical protein